MVYILTWRNLSGSWSTFILGNIGRTLPTLSLHGDWSLRRAGRIILQYETIIGTYTNVYTLRFLCAPVFTHLHTNEYRRNAASLQSRMAQSDPTVFLLRLLILSGFIGFNHNWPCDTYSKIQSQSFTRKGPDNHPVHFYLLPAQVIMGQ